MCGNVLLINPAVNPASQHRVINNVINTTIPTSIGILAGYLNNYGVSHVNIVDEQIDFIKDENLPEIILSLNPPRIIGLSVLTISSKRAYYLAEHFKKIDPKAIIIAGGIHPTVLPEELLNRNGIDVVVRGEGERTLLELVKLISNQKDYRDIDGISVKKNNMIKHNSDRPMIRNLDEIPSFPYHLFEKKVGEYTSFGSIFTSRGCPYNCIFCSSRNVSGQRYRYFSIDRVVSEITLLADKYCQTTIWMMDDNIAANRTHFLALLDAVIGAGLHKKVTFHGSMRGDNISDEILDRAKKANFKMISFGLETGSENLMKLINKGETVAQVIEAIKATDKKGIAAATTLIFGLPTETRKDRWDTIKKVSTLPLSSVRFNTLTPYPGTIAFEMLNRDGKVIIKEDWANFAVQYMWEGDDLPYVPEGTNRYELMFDTMFANLSYYISIKGVIRMLRSSFAGGNVIALSKNWFLSPKTIWKLLNVFLYLSKRFIYVSYKMIKEPKNTL